MLSRFSWSNASKLWLQTVQQCIWDNSSDQILSQLTHGLVTPYGGTDIGQHGIGNRSLLTKSLPNQCWHLINEVPWYSPMRGVTDNSKATLLHNEIENCTWEIVATSLRGANELRTNMRINRTRWSTDLKFIHSQQGAQIPLKSNKLLFKSKYFVSMKRLWTTCLGPATCLSCLPPEEFCLSYIELSVIAIDMCLQFISVVEV